MTFLEAYGFAFGPIFLLLCVCYFLADNTDGVNGLDVLICAALYALPFATTIWAIGSALK